MSSVQLSPGIFIKETDLSQITRQVNSTIAAIVIRSNKGPTMVPTLVTSASQFRAIFGDPNPRLGVAKHSAVQFLEDGNILYVIRAAADNAAYATSYVNI